MDAAQSLYIHIPFCRKRCAYCAFASLPYDDDLAQAYLDALEREFEQRATGRRFLTAYLGGGTPTALGPAAFGRLIRLVRKITIDDSSATWAEQAAFDLAAPPGPPARIEFGCEANPGTVDGERLAALRDAGVNRLSLGAQTFDPEGLAALGRIHDARAVEEAFAAARRAGFTDMNLDLIHGWPGQTREAWRRDLEQAARLGPEHLSCYTLTVEDGTPLAADVAAGRRSPPDEDELRAGWDLAGEVLEPAGWRRYEVSNFARPGWETRHHVNYWTGGEYVGLGAAAHSHESGRRYANTPDVPAYVAAWRDGGGNGSETFSERLAPEAKARETLVTWLRLRDGVPEEGFRRRTGRSWRALAGEALPGLEETGGVVVEGERLRLTPEAWPVADAVLSELV